MKVIGAGFMRTGTLSTQAALQRLGYPCYHMKEVTMAKGHLDRWHAFVNRGVAMDWQVLFEDYQATVDMPGCAYYEELMNEFPDAKVLLNVRDPEKWHASLMTLAGAQNKLRPLTPIIPKLRKFFRFVDKIFENVFKGDDSKENCIRVFNAHIEAVRQRVPADRLLVFQVQDGWEPLCEFLGHEVPDEPFPHLNEGDATLHEMFRKIFLGPWARKTALVALVLGAAIVAWQLL